MSDTAVALRDPMGAIAEIHAGSPIVQSLEAVKTSLVDMVDSLNVNEETQLGRMIVDSNERLQGMLGIGGILEADPENLIATVKMLNDVRLKSLDIKRKCLETALKAHQMLESKISLTMSLQSTGSGADIPPEAYAGAPADASGSSFAGIPGIGVPLSNPEL